MSIHADIVDALRTLSAARVEAALNKHGKTTEPDELVTEVTQGGHLIVNHPDEAREKKRDAVVDVLRRWLTNVSAGATEQFAQDIDLTRRIEYGYHTLLKSAAASDYGQMGSSLQFWSMIQRCAHECEIVYRRSRESIGKNRFFDPYTHSVTDDTGSAYFADAVLDQCTTVLSSTLHMLCHQHHLYQKAGVSLFPAQVEVSEQDDYRAGTMLLYGFSWQQWAFSERRLRYFGGELLKERHSFQVANGGTKELDVQRFTEPPGGIYSAGYLAKTRWDRLQTQWFFEMNVRVDPGPKLATSLAARVRLPPQQFVLAEEPFALYCLSETMCFVVTEDDAEYSGLLLVEWVRGYAALHRYVKDRVAPIEREAPALLFEVDPAELVDLLQRVGLRPAAAQRFMRQATFGRHSRDLYDSPLFSCDDGRAYLYVPGVYAASIARVVLSVLTDLKVDLTKKGPAFETRVIDYLVENGYSAKPLKFRIDSEEYQFDVLFLWERHLFVLECKNRLLASVDPVQSHHYLGHVVDDIDQVRRLRDASVIYRDKIQALFDGAEWDVVVPCVLYASPFSVGRIDGVYLYDASAFMRFFQQRDANVVVQTKGPTRAAEVRIPLMQLWDAEQPHVADLIRQMESPFQLEAIGKELEVYDRVVPLSEEEVMVTPMIQRRLGSLETTIENLGGKPEEVGQLMARADAALTQLLKIGEDEGGDST